MAGKNKEKGLFRVSIYLNEKEMTTMAEEAVKLNFREQGIPIKTEKPIDGEWLANTEGIGKVFKHGYEYWKSAEPERLKTLAEALEEEKALQQKIKALSKGSA